MVKPKFQVDEKVFYTIGKYAFLISAVMGLADWIATLGQAAATTIISNFATRVIFNLALTGFFAYLLKKHQEMHATDTDAEDLAKEMERILGKPVEEVKENNKTTKIKKEDDRKK